MTNRREFLQATGAVAVGFALPACASRSSEPHAGSAILGNRLTISATGEVELLLGKVELGQGIGTAMAQIAAEELDVDISRIRLRYVDTNISPDESYTFSSISVQQSGPPTRRAAAAAREELMRRAARKLGTSTETLQVADGEFLSGHMLTGLSYWSVIGNDYVDIDIQDDQALKSPDEYTIVGQSIDRIDIPGKVFGHASFLQDVRLPEMVHARVVRPRAERAELVDIDVSSAAALPGVLKIIRDGNFVAVVAEREGQARTAAQTLHRSIVWALPEDMPNEGEIYRWLKGAESRVEPVASKKASSGAGTLTRVNASFQRPYQAHASISPSAAIASYDGDQLTVWSHAQGMYPLRAGIAHVLQLDIENVRCIHREASGCYGHNGADDAACDAAAIAMHFPGRPVRLQWERSDEMTWEPYGSAMHIDISADADQSGAVRHWHCDLWSCPHSSRPRNDEQAGNMIYARQREQVSVLPPVQSIPQPNGGADRNGIPLYSFDSMEVSKHLVTDVPIRVSALRGLGAYANVFAIESFMDELAVRFDKDPFDYRLGQLEDERAIELLGRLRTLSDWDNRPLAGSGEGWGLGFARFKNRSAWVGVVMRVEIVNGHIRLRHATAVCDAGLIVNPDGATAQIEGSIVQSASWTLKEQVRFSQQQKQSVDWASYPILRFDEVPELNVQLMARDNHPSLGVGEAAQGPTAAAIANAVFHATGKRVRKLPIRL